MKKRTKTPVPKGIHPEEIVRIIGYDMKKLRSERRTADLSDQRRVVAVLLKRLGMVEWHIAEVLNRKRPSVNAMLHTSYLVENEIKKAMKLIEDSDYGKETTQEL